ncbi:MAG: efflux RND transporter periplasmic adaptor subunit [Proteobacteria bacterium]|nr:efflux RND transporter periplasmic adaptor subunit [Pseudomonadota bacterium]
MKISARKALPIGVLVMGLIATVALVSARPAVKSRAPERALPLVRVMEAASESVQLRVSAQGSVVPRTESSLVAEVAGRITEVSPSLAPGGFFESGDLLVQIDPSDYRVALERAKAGLARAESELDWARASLARRRTLSDQGVASDAALEDAQNSERVAEAVRRDAGAALEQARRDLERTRVVAPFAGRVREKHVDVGQFVSRGVNVARVYAVDYAEVRLPISDEDAAFVDLPIDYRDSHSDSDGPRVILRARFAGRNYEWSGRVVRTEGEIDPRTRMIHAVARVEDPYGRGNDPDRPPLAVGLFVDAEIEGRRYDDIVVLPRSALRGRDHVVVVDDDDTLRLRKVEILRRERDRVMVRAGVAAGEKVCISPLPVSVDGMRVRTVTVELDP